MDAPAMAPKRVMLGFLGTTLDRKRRARWRPTIDVACHADLPFDRFVLFYQAPFQSLLDEVVAELSVKAPELEVQPECLELNDPWDFEEVYATLHDFSRRYPFQSEDEYLVHIATGTHVSQICLFLLTESRHLPGQLLQSSPQVGDATGPTYRIIDLDLARYDRLAERFEAERRQGTTYLKAGIATANARFNQMIDRVERVALSTSDPLLLLGPTGAGKSDLARRIYQLKRRRGLHGALVEVNCATLRGDQAMSALFGHKRGAFTGAQKDRPGLLKQADGGLLFLDEVGELGLDEQAMLLRAIEMQTFLPVGADRETSSQFQLIAGTNRPLHECVSRGEFREDLLARLDLWTFRLPGLAERPEDIPPNVDFEVERVSQSMAKKVRFNAEGRAQFLAFAEQAPWPRNFRDFGAAIRRMATLSDGRIGPEDVTAEIERLQSRWRGGEMEGPKRDRVSKVLGDQPIDRFDRAQLEEVFSVCATAPTLSAAGRALFAESRKQRTSTNDADRLRKFLARWGLRFTEVQSALRGDSPHA